MRVNASSSVAKAGCKRMPSANAPPARVCDFMWPPMPSISHLRGPVVCFKPAAKTCIVLPYSWDMRDEANLYRRVPVRRHSLRSASGDRQGDFLQLLTLSEVGRVAGGRRWG